MKYCQMVGDTDLPQSTFRSLKPDKSARTPSVVLKRKISQAPSPQRGQSRGTRGSPKQLSIEQRLSSLGLAPLTIKKLCDVLEMVVAQSKLAGRKLHKASEFPGDREVIVRFLKECTGSHVASNVQGRPFYKLYVAWSNTAGLVTFGPKQFSRALQDSGIRRKKSSGIYYMGLFATKVVSDFASKDIGGDPSKKT